MFQRNNESILRYVTKATALSLGIGLMTLPAVAQQQGQTDKSAQQNQSLEQRDNKQEFRPAQAPGEPFYNEAEGAQGDDILRGTDIPSDYEPPTNWPEDQNAQRQGQNQTQQQRQQMQRDQQRQAQQRNPNLPAPESMQDRGELQWQASEQDLEGMFDDSQFDSQLDSQFVQQDRQWQRATGGQERQLTGTIVDLETLLVHGREQAIQAAGPQASLHPNDPVALISDDGNVYVIIDRAEQQQRQQRASRQGQRPGQGHSSELSATGPEHWPQNREQESYTTGQQQDRSRQASADRQRSQRTAADTRTDRDAERNVPNIRPTDHGDRFGTQFQADMQDRAANADQDADSDRTRTRTADAGNQTQIRPTQHGDRVGTQYQTDAKDRGLSASASADADVDSEGVDVDVNTETQTRSADRAQGTQRSRDLQPQDARRTMQANQNRMAQQDEQTQLGQQDRMNRQGQQAQRDQQRQLGQQDRMGQQGQQAQRDQQRQQYGQQDRMSQQGQRSQQAFRPTDLQAGQKVTLTGTVYEYNDLQGIAVDAYRVRQAQPFAQDTESIDRSARASD